VLGEASGNVVVDQIMICHKRPHDTPARPRGYMCEKVRRSHAPLIESCTRPSPRRPHDASSSSKVLACFKSRVSKPSVNQP
jgi:hypothetical protein